MPLHSRHYLREPDGRTVAGIKKRRGKRKEKGERKMQRCTARDVASENLARVSRALFCGNLMKTVIEYVHYTRYNACRARRPSCRLLDPRANRESPVRSAVVGPPCFPTSPHCRTDNQIDLVHGMRCRGPDSVADYTFPASVRPR